MPQFFLANFTGTDGTSILAYTSDSGHTFVAGGSNGDAVRPVLAGGKLNTGPAGQSGSSVYQTNATPATADYSHTVIETYQSQLTIKAAVRMSGTSAQYWGWSSAGGGVAQFTIGPSFTNTNGPALTLAAGETYSFTADTAGTTLTGYIQRASDSKYLNNSGVWVTGLIACASMTDATVTAAGNPGFWIASPSGDTGRGIQMHADQAGVGPASGITMTESAASGLVGVPVTLNFGVTPVGGTITGTHVVTPVVTGVAGSLSAASVSLSTGSPTGSLTFTPSATGTATINASDGSGLTAPTALTYTVTAAVTVPVTNANWYFSPYNWYSDGAGALGANNVHASSTYAQSAMPGAYTKFRAVLTTAGNVVLNLDNAHTSGMAAADYPQLAVYRDGSVPVKTQLSGATTQAITLATGLAAGTYDFVVGFCARGYTTNADQYVTPVCSVKMTSLTLPVGSSLAAPRLRGGNARFDTDSLGIGISNSDDGTGSPYNVADMDAMVAWPHILGAALDCEVGVRGFGGQGWITAAPVAIGAPAWPAARSNYSSGKTLLVGGVMSPAPDHWIVEQGHNDASSPAAAIASSLTAMRTEAGPTCLISLLVPFSGVNRAAFSGLTLDAAMRVVDVQGADHDGSHLRMMVYRVGGDTVHFDVQSSGWLAPRLAQIIEHGGPKTLRTATIRLVNAAGVAQAGVTGVQVIIWDQAIPANKRSAAFRGTGFTSNGSGDIVIPYMSTLPSGGIGSAQASKSDGTISQSPIAFRADGPVAVA